MRTLTLGVSQEIMSCYIAKEKHEQQQNKYEIPWVFFYLSVRRHISFIRSFICTKDWFVIFVEQSLSLLLSWFVHSLWMTFVSYIDGFGDDGVICTCDNFTEKSNGGNCQTARHMPQYWRFFQFRNNPFDMLIHCVCPAATKWRLLSSFVSTLYVSTRCVRKCWSRMRIGRGYITWFPYALLIHIHTHTHKLTSAHAHSIQFHFRMNRFVRRIMNNFCPSFTFFPKGENRLRCSDNRRLHVMNVFALCSVCVSYVILYTFE